MKKVQALVIGVARHYEPASIRRSMVFDEAVTTTPLQSNARASWRLSGESRMWIGTSGVAGFRQGADCWRRAGGIACDHSPKSSMVVADPGPRRTSSHELLNW